MNRNLKEPPVAVAAPVATLPKKAPAPTQVALASPTPATTTKEKTKRKRPKPEQFWDELFACLVEFKRVHGHCNVTTENETRLVNWVARQRKHRDKLTADQRAKLQELGFDFATLPERRDRNWRAKYERLKAFRAQFGHTKVPHSAPRDPQRAHLAPWSREIGKWVQAQQTESRREPGLLPWRKKLLDEIRFDWGDFAPQRIDSPVRNKRWIEKYQRLAKFAETHGHCLCPVKDKELGTWVERQRMGYKKRILSEERIELLNYLGFVWKVDLCDSETSEVQQEWDRQFERVKEYMKVHGHCYIPSRYKKHGLAKWLQNQKILGRKGELNPRRQEKLESIGIEWGKSLEELWDEHFQQFKAHGEEHGNYSAIFSRQHELYRWVCKQRTEGRDGTLSSKRREKLDSIGFFQLKETQPRKIRSQQKADRKRPVPNATTSSSRPIYSKRQKTERKDHWNPRYALGTRFMKEFPGCGKYEGEVMAYDGVHYKVYYDVDGDEEELSEYEFDSLELLEDEEDLDRKIRAK